MSSITIVLVFDMLRLAKISTSKLTEKGLKTALSSHTVYLRATVAIPVTEREHENSNEERKQNFARQK